MCGIGVSFWSVFYGGAQSNMQSYLRQLLLYNLHDTFQAIALPYLDGWPDLLPQCTGWNGAGYVKILWHADYPFEAQKPVYWLFKLHDAVAKELFALSK